MNQFAHSLPTRIVSLLLAVLVAMLGCSPTNTLAPSSGAPDYQSINFIAVPGGWVNAAGGNLLVRRVDMTIDTLFGTEEIAASYNSSSGAWSWNFEIRYDGVSFVDPTGAVYATAMLADGAGIPGSIWSKADADTIETRGGLAYHFDLSGNIDHVRWATLDYPRIQHVRSQTGGVELLSIEQCVAPANCTPLFEIEFNADGDPVAIEDWRTGRRTEYAYYEGRLVRVRDPLAIGEGWDGTRYEYGVVQRTLLRAIVNSEGERIEYDYQANRRIRDVAQIGAGNPTHHFEFNSPTNATGHLHATFHTNPVGGQTRYLIQADRQVAEITFLETGETRNIAWAGLRPAQITAANGATTGFSYTDDDLTGIVEPSGNSLTITHEPGALNLDDPRTRAIASVEDALGLLEQRSYGPDGRVVAIVNGAGDTVEHAWSPIALASITNPRGATFDYPIYGVHGHWLEMDGASADRRSVDPIGNVTIPSTGRQQGGILTHDYDPNRNLSALTVAATSNGSVVSQDAISVQRRSDGQMLYVARPGGGDHRFAYDALGRVESREEFVHGVWQPTMFEYDLAGNTAAVTRPNGMREEYDFDANGRLVAHRALRDGTPEGEETFVYQGGQVVSRSDSLRGATELYGYDSAGRMVSIAFSFGELVSGEYDVRSRLTAEVLSSPAHGISRRIEYEYDLANRVIRLGADGDELLAAWVFEDGAVAEIQYGNGLVRSFETDPATGTLVSAITENDVAEVVETTAVATTIEAGPSREQVRTATATTLASTVERYALTRGGHLSNPDGYVGQRVFGWDDEAGHSKTFDSDELSNWVDNTAGDSFSYNAERNRLVSATLIDEGVTLDYSYDEAGFATSRDGVSITWTATGRMASYGTDSISWDLRGRPIATSIGGEDLDFVYFGGRVASEPQSGALLPLDLGVARVDFDGAGRTFRHFDFRNNVSFVSDESGTIVSHYQYSAYGLDAVFGANDDAVRFVGRQQIGELMWLGARIYDPLVGRFLSPDPVFNLVNQFTYTLGNPVRYWDPDGRRPLTTVEAKVVTGVALALAGAGLAGCIWCLWWAWGLTVILFLDDVSSGAVIGPVGGPSGGGSVSGARVGGGIMIGGGVGGAVPSCGLFGIEPFFVLAYLWRRRRRRTSGVIGGARRW